VTVSFHDLVWRSIQSRGVPAKVDNSPSPVLVLERVARAAGLTNWFACRSSQDLRLVASELHPGSYVSFYLDQRIAKHTFSTTLRPSMLAVTDPITDEAVMLVGTADDIHLELEIYTATDLDDCLASLEASQPIWFGAFPAADDDGTNAVTITLPDEDGIVRSHPH